MAAILIAAIFLLSIVFIIFAGMKAKLFAIGLFLFALAACTQRVKVPEPVEGPTTELCAIDSLMWRQPDSALARLLPWFDTCCRDAARHVSTATAYNRHYANLLLSELLYKNYYSQTNRREFQQAVNYFDSLFLCKDVARNVSTTAFLAARAHYINGVGYYENDSVVEACKEYMKALEVMEGHFEEKELVGEKARFMALTYTHLTGLFSDQYLHDQAIYFGKKALGCYQKYEATPWHLAWMFCEIGSQYEMEGVLDSAVCYYQRGEEILPDTNNLSHRDIASRLAFLSYVQEDDCTYSLIRLKLLLGQAESPKEYYARCVTIGRIHLCEKDYDSAWIYLNKVFHESQNIDSKKQAAEWLVDICKTKGWDSKIMEYAEFLVPFANLNENQSHLKSQITTLFQIYEQERLKISHRKQLMTISRYVSASLITMAILSSVVLAFLFVYKKRHKQLNSQKEVAEKQLESERFAHEMKQKALAGKLTRSNEALRIQKEEKEELLRVCLNFNSTVC